MNYNVTVNGKVYQVTVEKVGGAPAAAAPVAAAPAAPVAAPAAAPACPSLRGAAGAIIKAAACPYI